MEEEFLHYLWQYRKYLHGSMLTTNGKTIEVISPGEYNTNAGADFFNAKIKIDNTLWVGNVEIHVNASDWDLHQHQKDAAYNNVILHVVANNDKQIKNSNGQVIPTFEMKCPEWLKTEYSIFTKDFKEPVCFNKLDKIDTFELNMWFERMLIERLESKVDDIDKVLKQTVNDWDETFYRLLFRSFGFGINGDPFERLARSIPLNVVLQYSETSQLVEALLFGQSGFLNKKYSDDYMLQLVNDYKFLSNKHNLKPMDKSVWKYLRLRPYNFPTIRIAQLVQLIIKTKGRFGLLINQSDLKKLHKELNVGVSNYWKNHFVPDKKSITKDKKLSNNTINLIIINTIIPFLFAYGTKNSNQEYKKRAVEWLGQLPKEKNSIISMWAKTNVEIPNAAISQAIIYLYKNYCKQKKCLRCRIGHKALTIK